MRIKPGSVFMGLGAIMVTAALALFLYNQQEQQQAGEAAQAVMPQLVTSIQENQQAILADGGAELVPAVGFEEEVPEMTETVINGYRYIGFLSIPSLSLELPVMTDWSYKKLNIAPCRFSGSIFTDDLVIMAHNYDSHFGRISQLSAGDSVIFTDMDGNQITYEVVAQDVLMATDVDEMTLGEFDLTLFTCTYGGKNRVTVRCDRTKE